MEMKSRIILSVFCCLFSLAGFSQQIAKGAFCLEGGIRAVGAIDWSPSYEDQSRLTLNIGPSGSYFFSKNWSFGFNLGLRNGVYTYSVERPVNYHYWDQIAYGLNLSHYVFLSKDAGIEIELNTLYGSGKTYYVSNGRKLYEWPSFVTQAEITPTLFYFLNKNCALKAKVGRFGYESMEMEPYQNEYSDFGLKLSLNDFTFGLSYFFLPKPKS